MGNIWDTEPTSGNKIILFEKGDSHTGQVKELTQVYVERFKKDVPAVVFEDGTKEGKIFEAGLTAIANSLLRLKPQVGEWIKVWKGENKGSYIEGGAERVEAPSDGKPVTKSNPAESAPEPARTPARQADDEPPF